MSATAYDWFDFALGMLGFLGVLWLYKARRATAREGRGLTARSLAGFMALGGCLMLGSSLLPYEGTVRWQAIALGFLLGEACGMLAGKSWVLRHPHGEEAVQTLGLASWLRRWWLALMFAVAAFVVATAPAFSHIADLFSGPASYAALGAGLGGLFLGFGVFLTVMQRR